MEGDTDRTEKPSAGKSGVTFHSENISETKAKEKREVFVHVVEQKKTIKQTAEEFQKKFEEARKRNQEAAAAAKNKIKKRLSKRAVTAIVIAIIVLPIAGFIAYYLIKNPQLTDPSLAAYLEMRENYEAGYKTYENLIANAKTPQKEAELHIKRGYAILKICGESCTETIAADAWVAERVFPSADSALFCYYLGLSYDEEKGSDYWLELSKARGEPSSWWKLDIWNNNNGAKNASK